MGDVDTLVRRIDDEFAGLDARIKRAQTEQLDEHRARQARLQAFERRLVELADVWRPRLEALIAHFGSRAHVTPRLEATFREACIDFDSELARVQLKFSATTDHDVRKLILSYDLSIVPVLMQFDGHRQAEFALDALDENAIGDWIDDRILDFVRTYLSLHENEHYLKEHMVEDPVAHVRFPSFAAAAKIEVDGRTYHFIDDETRREFAASQGAGRAASRSPSS